MIVPSEKYQKITKYFIYHFPWQFVMAVIFFFSGMSSNDLPDFTFRIWDKFLHFLAYGILGILMYRSFINSKWNYICNYAAFFSIFLTIIYGASDEIHQNYVPGRFPSYADWAADIIGAIVFIIIYRWIRSLNKKN
jgi:VanZ family protein